MAKNLREKMFRDMEHKDIFKQAQSYAFDYADNALERIVFPTGEAIKNLVEFIEDMPDVTGDSADILAQLNKYGSLAAVSQIGGRYFVLLLPQEIKPVKIKKTH